MATALSAFSAETFQTSPAGANAPASKAIVKGEVYYSDGGVAAKAATGDYEIRDHGDCVGFCNCGSGDVFILSLDTYVQHVLEGRIALAD